MGWEMDDTVCGSIKSRTNQDRYDGLQVFTNPDAAEARFDMVSLSIS